MFKSFQVSHHLSLSENMVPNPLVSQFLIIFPESPLGVAAPEDHQVDHLVSLQALGFALRNTLIGCPKIS
jgi:hypothetical protein